MSMTITVAKISEDGLRVTESLDPEPLGLATHDLAFSAPIAVSAFVQRSEDELLMAAEADSTIAVVCSRCLVTVQRPYHHAFQVDVEIQGRLAVDVTDELRQEILLSYPMTSLCREECRGLCPACGQNLNEGTCACLGSSRGLSP